MTTPATSATPTTPIAAIDIGSNTVHLVVARPVAQARDLEVLADELDLIRLGADVDATGEIGPERLARAEASLVRLLEIAQAHGAQPLLVVATEGIRAARNSGAVLQRFGATLGVEVALVSGEQEAALTFWGATSGHPLDGRAAVIDLGGGSIELVIGSAARVDWRVSLPLGSGTVHDRLAPADPPNAAELAQAEEVVATTLNALELPLPVTEVVACGGTATALAWLARQALSLPPPPGPHGAPEAANGLPALTPAVFEDLLGLLAGMPAAEVSARYGVEEVRARLLGAGAVVLRAALARLRQDRLRVSRRGIREGAILTYLLHGNDWLAAAARG